MLLNPKILYVLSFDETEPAITAQVAEISKALGAPIYLLAVTGMRYELWRGARDEQAGARENIERVAERLRGLRARVGHTLIVKGNQAVAAMEAAQRMQTEYIIIGAGERAAQEPAFIRTTAKALARSAEQHVWICKPHAESALQHILCAYNESRGAADGIRVSIDLARQFNAKMQLFSALPRPPPGIFGGDDAERSEAQRAAERAIQDQRKAVLEGFNLSGVTLAHNLCWAALASEVILEEAAKHRDGLLVVGAAGRRRFPTMMLGNTAEKILRACPSSLLIIK